MLKHFKHSLHFFAILIAFILTLIAYSYFAKTHYFVDLQIWAQANFFRFFLILVFVKILGIVWPPFPGIIFTIGAIPIIGWFPAFLAEALGWYIGATISFLLSRQYGLKVIKFFFGELGVKRVGQFKVHPNKELEALVLMKVFGGSIGEFINYAAGLTTIKFRNFFLSNVISSLIVSLPLFYIFSFALQNKNNLFLALVPLSIGIVFFYLFRKRYFIWDEETEEKPLP